MRTFETGATRDTEEGKPDYEGFLSPLALERFGTYMMTHQVQADGSLRASDNWQKGMPIDSFMKSMLRHVMDLWLLHRGYGKGTGATQQELLCAILFNTQGMLHEILMNKEDTL